MRHARGPLLTVDVGDRTWETTDVDDLLAEFVGGRALCTKLAHDRIPFDADPFGPENRLYLAAGPLQVSNMSFTGRMNCTGLSPLTDGVCSTNAGGYLSRNFAGTGVSAVEVVGESDELLAVHVTDGPDGLEVAFEEVPDLAGARVSTVSEWASAEHDLEAENLVTVGPAGENEVRVASLMTFDTRAFGRGGMGAVLGSKNVKTVSFAGDSTPEIALDEETQQAVHRDAATADDMMKRQGTTAGTEFINDNFSLPTRYFSEQSFEDAAAIGGDAVEEKKYKRGACSVCAFGCKLPTRDEESGLETEGPEFETVFSFGSNCAVDDVVDVMQSNELCDELGLDTIGAGNAVAAYLASEDEFGNAELVHETVEKIARREGVGDVLAEGVHRAHDHLGVEDWSVKGVSFAAHDGRVLNGQGLSYAVASRGGDHMYASMLSLEYGGELDPQGTLGKAATLVERENFAAFRDSAIVCAFSSDYVGRDALEALFDADYEDLLAVGAKTVQLERHFLNERGVDAGDDALPYDLPDLDDALAEYYEERGWTDDGVVPDDEVAAYGRAD